MSALLAAGGARARRQGVSVVPTIQWLPHGMTNSTLVGVRRISPVGARSLPAIAERGTTRCTPLEARTRRLGAWASGPPLFNIAPTSSLQTPVAAITLRARTENEDPSVRSATRTPTTGDWGPSPSRSRPVTRALDSARAP